MSGCPVAQSNNELVKRSGRWFKEELAYLKILKEDFEDGVLEPSVQAGTTFRLYASKLLECDPMRVSKRFTHNEKIGFVMYSPRHREYSARALQSRAQKRDAAADVFVKSVRRRARPRVKKQRSKPRPQPKQRDNHQDIRQLHLYVVPREAPPPASVEPSAEALRDMTSTGELPLPASLAAAVAPAPLQTTASSSLLNGGPAPLLPPPRKKRRTSMDDVREAGSVTTAEAAAAATVSTSMAHEAGAEPCARTVSLNDDDDHERVSWGGTGHIVTEPVDATAPDISSPSSPLTLSPAPISTSAAAANAVAAAAHASATPVSRMPTSDADMAVQEFVRLRATLRRSAPACVLERVSGPLLEVACVLRELAPWRVGDLASTPDPPPADPDHHLPLHTRDDPPPQPPDCPHPQQHEPHGATHSPSHRHNRCVTPHTASLWSPVSSTHTLDDCDDQSPTAAQDGAREWSTVTEDGDRGLADCTRDVGAGQLKGAGCGLMALLAASRGSRSQAQGGPWRGWALNEVVPGKAAGFWAGEESSERVGGDDGGAGGFDGAGGGGVGGWWWTSYEGTNGEEGHGDHGGREDRRVDVARVGRKGGTGLSFTFDDAVA